MKEHAGRIWEAVKRQRRHSTACPSLYTAILRGQGWYTAREDDKGPGSSWLKLNPNFRDMMLLSKEKRFGERSSQTLPFRPKWACALGPGWGTACDVLATLLTALLAGNERLFVAGCERASFSWLPEAIRLWTCLPPHPCSQGQCKPSTVPPPKVQGPRANISSATWGHLHHSRCFQTSRARGQKQEKYELSGGHSIAAQADLSRVQFTPEFAPGKKVKFTFKSLQTWKKNSNSLRVCSPKQACVPVLQLSQSTELYLLLAVT